MNTLVSTKWLADAVVSASKNFRVIDASWHLPSTGRKAKDEFKEKHIPGAQFFDLEECADNSQKCGHMLPSPSQFENYVGNLGITNDTHVVLYDTNEKFGLFSAQRIWWTFRIFGHSKVSILDGGFPKWLAENRPTTKDVASVAKVKYTAKFNPNLVKSFEDIRKNISSKGFQLADARPTGRFQGTAPEPNPAIKPGHIPGTVNIPFFNIMDPEKKTVKSEAELRELFAKAEISLDKPFAVTCGSGVSACCLALAAFMLGKEDVAVYDGSWTEWFQKADPKEMVNCPKD